MDGAGRGVSVRQLDLEGGPVRHDDVTVHHADGRLSLRAAATARLPAAVPPGNAYNTVGITDSVLLPYDSNNMGARGTRA